MARSFINSFLHLKEAAPQLAQMASKAGLHQIVDCLKNKRRFIKDNPRFAEHKSTVSKNTKATVKEEDMHKYLKAKKKAIVYPVKTGNQMTSMVRMKPPATNLLRKCRRL